MNPIHISVLGAGIVGICCGIALREQGHRVTLIDRKPPASETSHGNAGVICNCGVHPLASPGLITDLPKLAINNSSRFLLQYAELPRLASWLFRFLGNCNHKDYASSTDAVGNLAHDALPRHLTLMRKAGVENLLHDHGWLQLFRSQDVLQENIKGLVDLDHFAIPYEVVDRQRIQQLEPDLGVDYVGGLWMTGTPTVLNPGLLCQKYFDYFIALGGEFKQQPVNALQRDGNDWQVILDSEHLSCHQVVIAMGAWSNKLLEPYAIKLPLVQERGYHMMFDKPEHQTLHRSICDIERGYVLSPMADGIRGTTGCNLVSRELPPNPRQLDQLLPEMRQTFALGNPQLSQPWMGRRASTPDSIPLIGSLDGLPGLHVATGQCHLGLTLGPVSGALIADAVAGNTDLGNAPHNPNRFR